MKTDGTTMPTQDERRIAIKSADKFQNAIASIKGETAFLTVDGVDFEVPASVLQFTGFILDQMRKGQPFQLVPVASEFTTQAAADFLNCSRPHVSKLVDEGVIPATKVGRHRRIRYKDLLDYKEKQQAASKEALINMMRKAERQGLYDKE